MTWDVAFVCKVELRNMDTGDLAVFHVNAWLSKSKEDRQLYRDIPATVRGKSALKCKLHINQSINQFYLLNKIQ